MPRKFVEAMITSKDFLSTAAPQLDIDLIESPHLRLLAEWCLTYYGTYNEAPGKAIEPIYYSWLDKQVEPPEDSDAIRDLLGSLSDQYEDSEALNVSYLLDQLGNYLTLRKMDRLREGLEERVYQGQVQEGVQDINDFRVPELGRSSGMEPLNDPEIWEQAFVEGFKPLIEFTGDAGRFFNSAMTREALIGIQGPEKRGKTWWCLEFAIRALLQRRKVAFFEVGDLTEGQVLRRVGVRLSGRPMWEDQCGDIRLPKSLSFVEGEGMPDIIYHKRLKRCRAPITLEGCRESMGGFLRRCGLSKDRTSFVISVHPTSSVTVRDVDAIIGRWEIEKDFLPDVVIIDYADILAPENPHLQVRDQMNETWASLRRLSQERRCLVIAPTQADAASYDRSLMTMQNFSEDKRKLAHVTGMLGLNQTAEEKELQVMRLNWLVLRESPFSVSRCLSVAQCLTLGRVLCCSKMENPNVSEV